MKLSRIPLAALGFFGILSSYYMLRPLRESVTASLGSENLHVVFSATLLATFLSVPIFGWAAAKLPRTLLIALVYGVPSLALLVASTGEVALNGTSGVVFAALVSTFVLVAVSLFWSLMVEEFSTEEGAQWFGTVSAGGTAGSLAGPLLTDAAVNLGGTGAILHISAALLLAGAFALVFLFRFNAEHRGAERLAPLGGSPIAGITLVARDPYLRQFAILLVFFAIPGAMLYAFQSDIMGNAYPSVEARTSLFARVDLFVAVVSLLSQLFLTRWMIASIGTISGIVLLSSLLGGGVVVILAVPSVAAILTLQCLRRITIYSVANPCQEVLFTVVDKESKYKAKNVLETLAARGADAIGGWVWKGVSSLSNPSILIGMVALLSSVVAITRGRTLIRDFNSQASDRSLS